MKTEYQMIAMKSARSSLEWARKFKDSGDEVFYKLAMSHFKIHRAESR